MVSLQAPIYFRFLALVSWSWVVMNHKRVYSQENARMHFSRPEECIWWCCKHYSAVLPAGSLGIYSRKPLKMAENLLVFWYLQLKTIENSRKPTGLWCLQLKKPLEIQQNLCVFGYFQWKTIQNIKNLSVFLYLQLKTIENSKKLMCFFCIFNSKPLKIQKTGCVFWYLQFKTRGSMAKCILAGSVNAFRCALGAP